MEKVEPEGFIEQLREEGDENPKRQDGPGEPPALRSPEPGPRKNFFPCSLIGSEALRSAAGLNIFAGISAIRFRTPMYD